MIKGLGNDIVETDRIRQSVERYGAHFLDKLFTKEEQEYCHKFKDPMPHIAGRFAAKEAIAKAFGTGFGKELSWLELEILPNEQGKPITKLSPQIQEKFQNPTIHLSISHEKTYATAVAIWT